MFYCLALYRIVSGKSIVFDRECTFFLYYFFNRNLPVFVLRFNPHAAYRPDKKSSAKRTYSAAPQGIAAGSATKCGL